MRDNNENNLNADISAQNLLMGVSQTPLIVAKKRLFNFNAVSLRKLGFGLIWGKGW